MPGFLNPWLWLGLVAVAAPLWLHLRRKERRNIVRFSALRFLDDQPVEKKSPLWLRNLPLLLLRVLALCALLAAFAQPFLAQRGEAASSSEVYVLDNTLSRQAEHGLEHDRDFLIRQVRDAGARHRIAVVELTGEPRVVVNFGDAPQEAEAKLAALKPSAERGSFVTALQKASSLLDRAIGERKHITVLTDSQENQWDENGATPPFLAPGLVSVMADSTGASRPNFFVGEPVLQRIFLGDKALLEFTATVGHSGRTDTGILKLVVNGQEVSEHIIRLDDKTDQVSISLEWEADPAVWLAGSLNITAQPDDLALDDTAYFTLPPVTEGRVALLTHSIYLKTALSSAVSRGHWSSQVLQPADIPALLAAPPGKEADVLMIDADYLQSSAGTDLLDRYAKNDRGVFIMMGRNSPLLGGLLQKLGFERGLVSLSGEIPALQPIRYFVSESPIFLPFTVPDFSNLLDVRIGTPVHLHAVQAKPILFSQDGSGLIFEVPPDQGRILLSAFAFDREETDWVVHPSFVPFLDSALQYLRPQAPLNQSLEPGQMWVAQLPSQVSAVTAILRNAGGTELDQVPVDAQRHRAILHAPAEPGIYELSYDADPDVQQMLSVNPPLRESDLQYVKGTPEVLAAWTLSAGRARPDRAASAVLPARVLATQQNLWWKWMMLGSLALLVEMAWVASRGSKA